MTCPMISIIGPPISHTKYLLIAKTIPNAIRVPGIINPKLQIPFNKLVSLEGYLNLK
jgi:hypothetical protein